MSISIQVCNVDEKLDVASCENNLIHYFLTFPSHKCSMKRFVSKLASGFCKVWQTIQKNCILYGK